MSFHAALERAPHRFGFFAALRRLECEHSENPRLGCALRPADEAVRLGQEPSLAFAPSSLASFSPRTDGGAPRLVVNFFGLFGPNGALPLHLTEWARDRQRNAGDPTLARFADLFHHRLLELYYRAWANGQPTVEFDRPEHDRFAVYVGSLLGLGSPALRDRDALPDRTKLHHAGRLASKTRNVEGLDTILTDYFGLPVEIEEFVGEWIEIPEEGRWRLGVSPDSGVLGETSTLGSHVWDVANRFRIRFGPLAWEDYVRLLPRGESYAALRSLVRSYVGLELAWDVHLILEHADVPPLQLGRERLGWTTWVHAERYAGDAADLILDPERVVDDQLEPLA